MKKIYLLLIPFVSLAILPGCKKSTNDTVITYAGTIKEEIDNNPDYSYFKVALIKAGLSPTLGVANPPMITVFAPTNAAMTAVGLQDTLHVSGSFVRKTLDYVLFNSPINLADSSNPLIGMRALDSNDSLFFIKSGNSYLLNGLGTPTPSGKTFTNGLLYSLDKIPTPPSGNILGSISVDTTLSYLYSVIFKLADADINTLINGDGASSTLFAPTNQAFRDAGYDSTGLVSLPSVTIKPVLLYHFTKGRLFSTDFVSGFLMMANNENTTIDAGATITIKGAANATASTITGPNLLANPGIVHKIDQVLKP